MQRMNHPRGLRFLSKLAFITTVGLISAAIAYQATAQGVFTPPVGFVNVTCTNNSDSYVTHPFVQIPAFVGTVSAASGNIITVSGSPSWTAGQWAQPTTPNHYYPYFVQISSNVCGTYAGAYYTITNNDTSGNLYVGFANAGGASDNDLTGLCAGDYLQIISFWQLNTVWPSGTGVVPSTTSSGSGRRTSVLMPNLTASGINLVASPTYFYYNSAWRQAGKPVLSNYNDAVILPDQYVIVRQATNATDTTITTTLGQVVLGPVRIPVFASNTGSVDNSVGIYRPAVQTLLQSGLTNPAFKASTGTSGGTRQDQLFTYDNTVQGVNKVQSGTYYYYNNGWRKSGAPTSVDFSQSNVFAIASGVIIRKQTNTTSFASWINQPPY